MAKWEKKIGEQKINKERSFQHFNSIAIPRSSYKMIVKILLTAFLLQPASSSLFESISAVLTGQVDADRIGYYTTDDISGGDNGDDFYAVDDYGTTGSTYAYAQFYSSGKCQGEKARNKPFVVSLLISNMTNI